MPHQLPRRPQNRLTRARGGYAKPKFRRITEYDRIMVVYRQSDEEKYAAARRTLQIYMTPYHTRCGRSNNGEDGQGRAISQKLSWAYIAISPKLITMKHFPISDASHSGGSYLASSVGVFVCIKLYCEEIVHISYPFGR